MSLFMGLFSKLGTLFARFRKKKSVIESLEEIDKQIREFEKYKQKNEMRERKYIAALVLYSVLMYIVGALVYYIYLMPKNMSDRIKTLTPFCITPLIIYGLRRFLKWLFIKRTNYFEKRLNDLKEEKKTILEEVKEKETYKKAKEILERFGSSGNVGNVEIAITPPSTPMHPPHLNQQQLNQSMMLNRSMMIQHGGPNGSAATNLVHRNVKQNIAQQFNPTSGPQLGNKPTNTTDMQTPVGKSNNLNATMNADQQGPPSATAAATSAGSATVNTTARTLLPRPIINPNRTFLDKVLDFIIGEGPNNRYALICKNCHFHNGMALKEEFEFIAFRCAYCLFHNEARKAKLTLPTAITQPTQPNSGEASNLRSSSASSLSGAAHNQTMSLNDTVVSSNHHRSHHHHNHHLYKDELQPQQQQQQQNRTISGRVEKHNLSSMSSGSTSSNKLKLVNSQNGQLVNKSGKLSITMMKNNNNKIRSSSTGSGSGAQLLNDSMGSTVNSTSSAHSSPSTSLDDISASTGVAGSAPAPVTLPIAINNKAHAMQQMTSQSSSKINDPVSSEESENGTGFVVYHQKVRHNSAIDSLLNPTGLPATNGHGQAATNDADQEMDMSPSKSVENLKMM